MTVSEAINQRIINLAKERNITINKLCTTCGITQSTINNLLSKTNKNPKILTILKICEGLDLELYQFFKDPLFMDLDEEE